MAGATDQLGADEFGQRCRVLALDHANHHGAKFAAHIARCGLKGRQTRRGIGGRRDVVEADHGEVIGNRMTSARGLLENG